MKLTSTGYFAMACFITGVTYFAGSRLQIDPASLHQTPRTCLDPISEPFVVSDKSGSDTGWPEAWPEVAVANDGRQLVVAYTVLGKYSDGWAVVARRFDLSGTPLGDEFLVDAGRNTEDPSIDFDDYGNFTIAWHSSGTTGEKDFNPGHSIYLRAYSSEGKQLSDTVLVPQDLDGNQWRPTNLVLADGTSLITWYSETGPDQGSTIRGRLFKAGKAISDEFHISTAQDRAYKQWRMGHASKTKFFISVWWDDRAEIGYLENILQEPTTIQRLLDPDSAYLARVIDYKGNLRSDVLGFARATDFVIDDSGNWIGNSGGIAQWHTSDGNSIGWPFPLHQGEFAMSGSGYFVVYGSEGCIWPYTTSGNLVSDPVSMGGVGSMSGADGNDHGNLVATWDNSWIPGPSPEWDVWVSISSIPHLAEQASSAPQDITLISPNKTIPHITTFSLLIQLVSVYLLRRAKDDEALPLVAIGLTLNIVSSYILWLYAGPILGGVIGRLSRYHQTAALFALFVALATRLVRPKRRFG